MFCHPQDHKITKNPNIFTETTNTYLKGKAIVFSFSMFFSCKKNWVSVNMYCLEEIYLLKLLCIPLNYNLLITVSMNWYEA